MYYTLSIQAEDFVHSVEAIAQAEASRPWWEQAVRAYDEGIQERTVALKRDLARRVRALTDRELAFESIYADVESRAATVRVDGTLFRLERANLMVVRPCAYCGTGAFNSPPIADMVDLGYALAVWRPLHQDCPPDGEDDL